MNRLCFIICILLTLGAHAAEKVVKISINQFVSHTALDMTTKGIIDGLAHAGYKQGVNLDLHTESAQASPALSSQIAAKFIGQGVDIAVGVGTVSSQSFTKYAIANKIKLVFSSVTDPLQAKLVISLDKPGNNTSGVSNFIALEPQLELFQQIQPNLKKLGFLYNPSEINSINILKALETACRGMGITVVKQSANRTAEVSQAAIALADKVDAIFISNDNTALAALQAIINVATKVKIPVFVSDTDAVKLGAVAALGPNQYQIGLQTAKIIVRALGGEDLDRIPVEFPHDMEVVLNENAAKTVGIVFSEDLKSKASSIIKGK